MPYTIYAAHGVDGTKSVIIERGDHRTAFREKGEKAIADGTIDDWQSAKVDTLKEVRSVLAGAFGIGWYGVARRRVKELEACGRPDLDDLQTKAERALTAATSAVYTAHWYIENASGAGGPPVRKFTLTEAGRAYVLRDITDTEEAVKDICDALSRFAS